MNSGTLGMLFRAPAVKPGKQPVAPIALPQPVPFQPPPPLSVPKPVPDQSRAFTPETPAAVPFQPAPEPSPPSSVPIQTAPALATPSPAPTAPPPALSAPSPAPTSGPPVLKIPAVIPTEPAPALSVPAAVPFEPAPPLKTPPVVPFEPAPLLTAPAVIPFEPAPPAVIPPAIPLEPAPPAVLPQPVPFEPPPALTAPAVIPFEPAPPTVLPPAIPLEPAPVLAAPAPVPPDPTSTPGPERHEDIVRAKTDIVQVGLLGANVGITYGGKIQLGFDPHAKEVVKETINNAKNFAIAKAQALAQQALEQATAPITKVAHDVEHRVEQALRDLNPFKDTAKSFGPSTVRDIRPDMPTGAPAQPARSHQDMDATQLDAPDYPASDPDFTYSHDRRQAAQASQDAQALAADSDVNRYNSWNNNFQYGDVQAESPALTPGLQRSFDVSSDGGNMTPAQMSDKDAGGYIPFSGKDTDLPQDDQVYVPLVFTDLRPANRQYRAVYFRPFLKNLSENFAPQWNMANYFGRVDPVATFKSTDRTINLSFKLVCFGPEDLQIIYRKLAWLSSMCYPQYQGGAYFAGPVVRLRVGDVISAIGGVTGKGVPGVITSLDVNFDEATWELQSGMKLPREVDVSVGFHVLHDRAIGLVKADDGSMQFGGIIGKQGNIRSFRAAFGATNYLDVKNPIANPSLGQVPAIVPTTSNPIGDFSMPSIAVANSTDGSQPYSENISSSGFAGSNSDSGLDTGGLLG